MNILSSCHRALFLFLGLAAVILPASAEDIDIYSGVNSNSDLPNVLLVLDNSANWSSSIPAANCYFKENGVTTTEGPKASNPGMEQGTKMAIEKCALYNLIDSLPVKSGLTDSTNALFNVGIMLLNESPDNGAYPRIAFTTLTTDNKVLLKAQIKALTIGGDKGSNADFAKAMYESYLYFKGEVPYQGTEGSKWDHAAVDDTRYKSPATSSCARNYLILVANGAPESSENNDAMALLRIAGGNTSLIEYPTSYVKSTHQANWADEFSRFMRGVDVSGQAGAQGIVTHGVAVTGASSDGLYPNFIEAIATVSGGTYHAASDADTLLLSLQSVFNDIQAVNSVFAASSLPVSVNARGTYLNQVYMGMFRPDANAAPRWRGNLKQYKFGLDSLGNLRLVDSTGAAAVSSSTGFIATGATSFWSTPSTFWLNQLMGTPASSSDAPDGEVVEKGAAAQHIRSLYLHSQTSRNVLTCVDCTANTTLGGSSATEFTSDNELITTTLLGVDSANRTALIDWVRGTSNAGDEQGPGVVSDASSGVTAEATIRPSVHGDVLHSRPAVVNYGGTTGVVVFYGANDGMLHAIDGNQTGTGAGNELWGFVPQELYSKLNRLRANSPSVKLSTTVSITATPRDYFVDGPIGVYQKFNTNMTVNRVIIYVGMRRGGRMLYALDVTNPTSPKFLWKKTNSDLGRLGQTWSEPKPTRIRGNTNPVLIFGGGFDAAAEDIATPGTTTMGDRVYVLDAITGTELKALATSRSVAADVTLVDSDFDGYVDRVYAVDLGGKVYRVDLETAESVLPDDWSIYTLADLSGGTSTGRKFFSGPDAIVTRLFTALMVGSGDREKPLLSSTQDHFFQILDNNTSKGVPSEYTPTVWGDLAAASTTSSTVGRGCYVTLDAGEKVVNAATSIGGVTYFGTNRPTSSAPANTCTSDLGVAKSYAMPLFCVAPTSSVLSGGGLPPSPVTGIVTVAAPSGGGTQQVPFCIGCPNPRNSGIEGSRVNPVIKAPRSRLYWYHENER